MSNRRLSRRVLIRRLLLTLAVIAVLWVGFAFVALRMPISGEVTYALDWVWGAAQPLSEGGESGWRVTTTAGVEVTVREGYLGSYSLQLIYCPHKHSPLSWLFGEIITARAGHGEGIDVTRYLASAIEPLARPTRFVLGTVSGNEPLYCEGHYLAARPDRAAAEAQPTTSMVGVTLWLSGEYRLPGATSAMPFTFRTSLANGAIRDILDGAG
ncbi:MAG TPA: hypothetical protein PLD47_16655, partial [Aggregatilineales bacterium]|nr:hypothetical protein [Aggregatilineales bacterium]